MVKVSPGTKQYGYGHLVWIYILLALVFGFLLGKFASSSAFVIKSSMFEDVEVQGAGDKFLEENAWLEEYEVNPQKMGNYVQENIGGYIDEDGVVHFTK